MKRIIFQILLLLILCIFFISSFLLVNNILNLPFVSTNEALHKADSAFTLDFLIPAGTYIDNTLTIGDVIKIRTGRQTSLYETMIGSIAGLIPERYRQIADLVVFLFWSFLIMTFLRIFTFTGYGRALRISLLMGGIIYYFMPDFSPGKTDDTIFLGIPLLIIIVRAYISWKIKSRKRFVNKHAGSRSGI
ncbi:MAG TPA: hypothetical protein PK874_01300 [Desulfobacteraceae bacterium]|nr:hypothetical protein [Desulfobacteraceae bacterium]HPJ66561.1 hypothetical protein [Desulfobacteraceae bacterium]HPQ27473.1 hypothetical protein [Desulfobacteraceae bacterium]